MTNEQFFKLPRWAQNEINSLKNNITSLEKKLNTIFSDEEQSNTVVKDLFEEKKLPNNTTIKFKLPNGYLEARVKGDFLYVYGSYDGTLHLVVQPEVSNVVNIGFK